ncbi:hypothetical protein FB446DRAFT_650363 [Lentinula raphanica]|nr:hypothetical protein FB446DRAFT_650363 [Lentinula raphanica]
MPLFIMNRLSAVEANHTLYVRYVEQQTSSVREMIRQLSEDDGRLEGIVSISHLVYQFDAAPTGGR